MQKIDNSYLRYANCWEDAEVLRNGLKVNEGQQALSIASAGDNSFSLLVDNPAKVVAVDINQSQLNLVELKKAAFRELSYEQFLEFLGFRNCQKRLDIFKNLQATLPKSTLEYWQRNLELIEVGVIHTGKFEHYFQLFRNKVMPWIHRADLVNQLFQKQTAKEQKDFYNNHWNTWRWRLAFKLFFSKWVMGRFGRDSKFLEQVDLNVGEFIFDRAEEHLKRSSCQTNYFLNYILRGEFGVVLPHYARAENFKLIKSRIDRLETFEGYAQDAAKKHGRFDRFNLSNIFEYMTPSVFKKVSNDLTKMAKPNARFAYWNLMVPRQMESTTAKLETDFNQMVTQAELDNGFFYRQVIFQTLVDRELS